VTASTLNDLVIASSLIALTILALAHLALFPYLKRSQIAPWLLVITVVPIVGPVAWFFYSAFKRDHVNGTIRQLTGEGN
jgi:hypothetical protein